MYPSIGHGGPFTGSLEPVSNSMQTSFLNDADGESLSAMADGELRGDEFAQTLAACERDPLMLASWHDYHLIGDVLRSPGLARVGSASPFLARLQNRLAQEALQPMAQADASAIAPTSLSVAFSAVQPAAANEPFFGWQAVAGFACVVAVATLVWAVAVATSWTGLQLAQNLRWPTVNAVNLVIEPQGVYEPLLVASPQGTMVRDARLEELLAAHKQMSGNSALQMPSGFLRNATFETSLNAPR